MLKSLLRWLKSLLQIDVLPECVGIDLSTSAIKLVELKPNSFIITQHVMQDTNMPTSGNNLDNIITIAGLLQQYWVTQKFKFKTTVLSLPYSYVITKIIRVPLFKHLIELDTYIKSQIQNIFEVDPNIVDFDYSIINKNIDNKNQLVLVVIVKKEKLEEIEALMNLANLPVRAVYVESYVLYNLMCGLFAHNRIDIAKQSCLLLDIGTNKIKVLLVHDYELVYINEIPTKYNDYLIKLLLEDCQLFDRNWSEVHDYLDDFASNIDKFEELVNIILSDIMKHIQLAKSQVLIENKINIQRIANICIAGGGSCIPGLVEKLNSTFKLRVIEMSELLKLYNPQLTKNQLSRLTTAVALSRDKYND